MFMSILIKRSNTECEHDDTGDPLLSQKILVRNCVSIK